MPTEIKLRSPFAEAAERLAVQSAEMKSPDDQFSPLVIQLIASAQLWADRRAKGESSMLAGFNPDMGWRKTLITLASEVLSYLEYGGSPLNYGEGLSALTEELRGRIDGLDCAIKNGGLEDLCALSDADRRTALRAQSDLEDLQQFLLSWARGPLQPRIAVQLFAEMMKKIYAEMQDAAALVIASGQDPS